jgi:uncharacterized membrane protein YqjE
MSLHGPRAWLSGALSIAQTRLSLLQLEVQEERLRLASLVFNLVLAALFLGFFVVFLVLFVTVWLWDSHRLWALGLSCFLLLVLGLWAGTRAAARFREGSALFSASLAELSADQSALTNTSLKDENERTR